LDNEQLSVLSFVGRVISASVTPAITVSSVERLLTYGPVYNLEVEDAHEFYANGILTHNSWRYDQKAFDNFIFGLRLGRHPQVFWTGTPKPKPFIKMLMELKRSITRSGSTYENAENLTDIFYDNIAKYEGTRIGRQEIYGEVIDPEEAGFVKRSDWQLWPYPKKPLPKFRFVIMSLDTAFTEKTWDKKEQTGDPTACTVWGLFEHEGRDNIMLLDAWEDYLGFPALIRRVRSERNRTYGDTDEPLLRPALISPERRPRHQGRPVDMLLIEDTGSGKSLIQMLANEGIIAQDYPTDMDKLSKLHGCSPLFPHRRVWAIESEHRPGNPISWAEPVITQFCTYVGEGSLTHDDLLDTGTQALLLLMHRFNIRLSVRRDPNAAIIAASERLRQVARRNPYDG
jgi:phage terminase large subunit-like protein